MAQQPDVPVLDTPHVPPKVIKPIAFWKTRSWWLGVFPALLTLLDAVMQQLDTPAAIPVANSIAILLNAFGMDLTGQDIVGYMRAIAPLYAVIVMHQRRGINRPYSTTTANETDAMVVIKKGAESYNQGREIVDLLRKIK